MCHAEHVLVVDWPTVRAEACLRKVAPGIFQADPAGSMEQVRSAPEIQQGDIILFYFIFSATFVCFLFLVS